MGGCHIIYLRRHGILNDRSILYGTWYIPSDVFCMLATRTRDREKLHSPYPNHNSTVNCINDSYVCIGTHEHFLYSKHASFAGLLDMVRLKKIDRDGVHKTRIIHGNVRGNCERYEIVSENRRRSVCSEHHQRQQIDCEKKRQTDRQAKGKRNEPFIHIIQI